MQFYSYSPRHNYTQRVRTSRIRLRRVAGGFFCHGPGFCVAQRSGVCFTTEVCQRRAKEVTEVGYSILCWFAAKLLRQETRFF